MASITSGIHDNHKRGLVGEFLKKKIQKGADLSIVSAYFTIYAFEALKEQLLGINHLNFLFGEPGFIRSLDPDKTATKFFKIVDEHLELAKGSRKNKFTFLMERWNSSNLASWCSASKRFGPIAGWKPFFLFDTVWCLALHESSAPPMFLQCE